MYELRRGSLTDLLPSQLSASVFLLPLDLEVIPKAP